MGSFPLKRLRGVVYDMAHLNDFRFQVPADGSSYWVGVKFTCHCFTKKLEAYHSPELLYEHEGEKRAFDVQRYELSKFLPAYIRSLVGSSVYWSNKGSFFFWRTPNGVSYLVFFTALQASKGNVKVRIKIGSAYPKSGSQFASPVDFAELMKMKAAGEFPELGPKVQITRK